MGIFSYQCISSESLFLSEADKELSCEEHWHKVHLILCNTICVLPITFIFLNNGHGDFNNISYSGTGVTGTYGIFERGVSLSHVLPCESMMSFLFSSSWTVWKFFPAFSLLEPPLKKQRAPGLLCLLAALYSLPSKLNLAGRQPFFCGWQLTDL